MHYVIQRNMMERESFDKLIKILRRFSIPFSEHTVVPFSGKMIPELDSSISNPIIFIGSCGMSKYENNWIPGIFINESFDYEIQISKWGDNVLNSDASITSFNSIPFQEQFFIRPVKEGKSFTGSVINWKQYQDWLENLQKVEENILESEFNPNSKVVTCKPKTILREYRTWIIDKEVVTSSLYKIGDTVFYSNDVERRIIDFAEKMARLWSPDRAYVMDIAVVPVNTNSVTEKIIEINSINSSGFYAASLSALIQGFENMGY